MSLCKSVNKALRQSLCLFVWALLMSAYSCKKEKDYLYEVNPVAVNTDGTTKSTRKSTAEFISIAWADLFSTQVPQSELLKLNTVYSAFGDKQLIEDRILLNLLTRSGVQIPPQVSINGDTAAFIDVTYQRLYNREPSAFERYYLKEQIRLNSAMTSRVLWYGLMSSEEYRYY